MFPATLDDPVERARLAARLRDYRVAYDDYRAKTLADARAAAMQAIDLMTEEGWAVVRLEATRDGSAYCIAVTYSMDEE